MAEKLTREVEPPQRQHSGLGVMLIASAAMFFAVSGSAFILRARMADSTCPRAHVAPASSQQPSIGEPPTPAQACGHAIYRDNADGSVSVTFDLCPPPEPTPRR